ncbi:MAG: anthrone oxygenase family protein [Thermodesulfobacteriota bacterium]
MELVNGACFALTLAAALGAGVIGGVFFAFSSFVMKALARLPDAHGMTAMQAVNVTVLNRSFLGTFLGTGVVCVLTAIAAVLRWHEPGAGLLLAGSVLYLAGTLGVTVLFNVPRNEALAVVEPEDPNGAALWAGYVESWTFWNHVRTGASIGAAAAFTLALCA